MKNNKAVLLALFILICSHLVFLFFSPFAYYQEDINTASLGLDIINGHLRLPFWFYQESPHSGGAILSGIINIPFYYYFGGIYLALKISGLFLIVINFVLWIHFLISIYGKKIILPLSIFFIFPPPRLLIYNLIRAGNGIEFILLISTTLLLTYSFIYHHTKSKPTALLLGASSGLGFWIQYGHITATFSLLLIWFLVNKKFYLSKEFKFFLFGLTLGLIPFIIYNFQFSFISFFNDPTINKFEIFFLNPSLILNRLQQLFSFVLPASFLLPGFIMISPKAISLFIYFFIFSSIIYLLRGNKSDFFKLVKQSLLPSQSAAKLEIILLNYLLVTFLVLVLFNIPLNITRSNFVNLTSITSYDFYYITFLQPFFLIILSIFITKLIVLKSGLSKVVGLTILTLTATIFMYSFFQTIFIDKNLVKSRAVGISSEESIHNNIDIRPISNNLSINYFLFKPHQDIYTNAYEAGFSYSWDLALYKRLLKQIGPEFRTSYLSGGGSAFNFYLQQNELKKEQQQLLTSLLSELSHEEKKQFFYHTLIGLPFWIENDHKAINHAYLKLSNVYGLSQEDKTILEITHQELIYKDE